MRPMDTKIAFATLSLVAGVCGCTADREDASQGEARPVIASTEKPPAVASPSTPSPGFEATPERTPAPPASASPGLTSSLSRLHALGLFEVGELRDWVGAQPESSNCYVAATAMGRMCVGEEAAHAADIAAAERRLLEFVDVAEKTAETVTHGGPFGPGVHLAVLQALHLFEVGAFIVDQPESSSCYGFCNPTNQLREAQLDAIVRKISP